MIVNGIILSKVYIRDDLWPPHRWQRTNLPTSPTVVSPLQHAELDLTLHAHRGVCVGDPERCDLAQSSLLWALLLSFRRGLSCNTTTAQLYVTQTTLIWIQFSTQSLNLENSAERNSRPRSALGSRLRQMTQPKFINWWFMRTFFILVYDRRK